ncbi:MAG: hypothetical protein M3458_18805 [Acidobacteriota bacterium]|nr:hypothetical protein [Acidobacteriota bacterium]MDQ3652279.1 hypothetical protein [Acidobacteriota bacterium]
MKRFQQFFGATLLTSLYAVSTFAGNMGFPAARAEGNMGFPAAAPQQLDATTEVFINVLQNIFLMF